MNRKLVLALIFNGLALGTIEGQTGDQLKLAMPGAEHEKLADYKGEWDIEIKMGGG